MPGLLRNRSLTLAMFALFALSLAGMSLAGLRHHNEEQRAHGQAPVGYGAYLASGAFVEAVFENWESEFLQMGLYVLLTAFLYQQGSAESKDPDQQKAVDADARGQRDKRGAPGPVRRGGLALTLYEHSLTLALLALFVLSILLRQEGSPESKPVPAPHSATGEG